MSFKSRWRKRRRRFKKKWTQNRKDLKAKYNEYKEEGKIKKAAATAAMGVGIVTMNPALMGVAGASLAAAKQASEVEAQRKALEGSLKTAVQNPQALNDEIGIGTELGLSPGITSYLPILLIAVIVFYLIFKG